MPNSFLSEDEPVADVANVSASGRPGRRAGDDAELLAGPPDEGLVERVADGEAEALGLLYDRYASAAFGLARRICADEERAREVVREVFVRLWRDPQRFDARRGKFSSWLLTRVQHRAVDAVRELSTGQRRELSTRYEREEWPVPAAPDPERLAFGVVRAGQVHDALAQLSGEQRRTLALAYLGGYTLPEIAALTRASLAEVQESLFGGMRQLRRLLVPLQWDELERGETAEP